MVILPIADTFSVRKSLIKILSHPVRGWGVFDLFVVLDLIHQKLETSTFRFWPAELQPVCSISMVMVIGPTPPKDWL